MQVEYVSYSNIASAEGWIQATLLTDDFYYFS